jgi:hypothetical protein
MNALDIIRQIQDEKRGKRHPEHATVDEVKSRSETAYNELQQLYNNGKIRLGRTINGNYIHPIK